MRGTPVPWWTRCSVFWTTYGSRADQLGPGSPSRWPGPGCFDTLPLPAVGTPTLRVLQRWSLGLALIQVG